MNKIVHFPVLETRCRRLKKSIYDCHKSNNPVINTLSEFGVFRERIKSSDPDLRSETKPLSCSSHAEPFLPKYEPELPPERVARFALSLDFSLGFVYGEDSSERDVTVSERQE